MQRISSLLNLILVLMLSITIFSCINPAGDTEFYEGNLLYREDSTNKEGVHLLDYTGSASVLIIPERTVSGKIIIGITEKALFNKGLTLLELPAGITSIGDAAFAGNPALSSVEFKGSNASVNVWGGSPEGIFQGTLLEGHFKQVDHGKVPQGLYETIEGSSEAIGDYTYDLGTIYRYTPASGIPEEQGGRETVITQYAGSDTALSLAENVISGAGNSYTVSSIGPNVFTGKGLTHVLLPAGITSIGDAAFAGNPALSSVEFKGSNASVNVWGESPEGIFQGTLLEGHFKQVDHGKVPQGLYETIEGSSETIGDYTYNLGTIYRYTPASGIPEEQGGREAVITQYAGSDTSLSLAENVISGAGNSYTVSSIGPNVFTGKGLTHVLLPAGITSIGDAAFAGNPALSSVEFKGSNASVNVWGESPEGIFQGTLLEGHFKQVDHGKVPQGLYETIEGSSEAIGDYTYNLGTIYSYTPASGIPEEQGGREAVITQYAGSDTALSIPDTVTSVTSHAYVVSEIKANALSNKELISVVIPASITSIGDSAFADNEDLVTAEFKGSNTVLGSTVFQNTHLSSTVYISDGSSRLAALNPGSVLAELYSAFQFSSITGEVGLPETSADIHITDYFTDHVTVALASVAIPASVTLGNNTYPIVSISGSIPPGGSSLHWEGAFENKSLTSVDLSKASNLLSIDRRAFIYNELTEMTIPASVTSLGSTAFRSNALTKVTFEGASTYLNDGVFSIFNPVAAFSSLGDGETPEARTYEVVMSNNMYYALENGEAVLAGRVDKNVQTISIDANVSIEGRSYDITGVGATAFYGGANKLTSVDFSNASKLLRIGTSAFQRNDLRSVTIPSSVESIGRTAFLNNNITSVDFSNTVSLSSIKFAAFSLNGITSVRIPASVTNLEMLAFDNNPLVSVDFDGDATVVSVWGDSNTGDGVFNSTPLKGHFKRTADNTAPAQGSYKYIAGTSETIDGYAYSLNEHEAYVPTAGPRETSPSAQAHITAYTGSDTSLRIPGSVSSGAGNVYTVTEIGASALSNKELTSAVIPASITSIGDSAFTNNTNLSSIEFQGGNALINVWRESPNGIFAGTLLEWHFKRVADHTVIPQGLYEIIPQKSEIIGDYTYDLPVFHRYTSGQGNVELNLSTLRAMLTAYGGSATDITIPEDIRDLSGLRYEVTYIGQDALRNKNLSHVVIPPATLAIDEGAFADNDLTSLIIPAAVLSLGHNAFSGNALLASVNFMGTETAMERWGDDTTTTGIFQGTLLEGHFKKPQESSFGSVSVAQGLYEYISGAETTQGDYTYELGTIQRYTPVTGIPEELGGASGATIIAYGGSATTITIPGSIIESGTTYPVRSIGVDAFRNKNLTSVSVPENVSHIRSGAFADNTNLFAIEFEVSDTNLMGSNVFENTYLVGDVYKDSDGTMVNFANNATIASGLYSGFRFGSWTIGTQNSVEITDYNGAITEVLIPSFVMKGGESYTVTSLGNEAFRGNELTSVVLPPAISSLGVRVFSFNRISSVDFSGNTVLQSISEGAFHSNKLTSLVIPAQVSSIGASAFRSNDIAGEVDFASMPMLQTLGGEAFRYNAITRVKLSQSITSIGDHVFSGNDITSVDLSVATNLGSIGTYAFWNNDITNVNFSGATNLSSIGDYAFSENAITSVDLSAATNLGSIQANAFSFNNIVTVDFTGATSLASIGAHAFAENQITSVNLSGNTSLSSIGENAFAENDIADLSIPLGLTSLGDNAFKNNLITEVTFHGTSTQLGTDTFLGNPVAVFSDLGTNGLPMATTYSIIIINNLYYGIVTGEALAAGRVPGSARDITIPAVITHNGISYNVRGISDRAFEDRTHDDDSDDLTSVDFSNAVNLVSIGESAFEENLLDKVDLSTVLSLRTIGPRAFSFGALTEVALPAGLTSIGEGAFVFNPITLLIIDATPAPSIGDEAFLFISTAPTLSIPNSGDTSGYPLSGESWGGATWTVITHTVP